MGPRLDPVNLGESALSPSLNHVQANMGTVCPSGDALRLSLDTSRPSLDLLLPRPATPVHELHPPRRGLHLLLKRIFMRRPPPPQSALGSSPASSVNLDAGSFPHIFAAILSYSDYSTLLALRLLSRSTRADIDEQLANHLVVRGTIMPRGKAGWHPRIAPLFAPRFGLNLLPLLLPRWTPAVDPLDFFAENTRVVDLEGEGGSTPAVRGVLVRLLQRGAVLRAPAGRRHTIFSGCMFGRQPPPGRMCGHARPLVSLTAASRVVMHVDVGEGWATGVRLGLGGIHVGHLVVVVHVHAQAGSDCLPLALPPCGWSWVADMEVPPGKVSVVCENVEVLLAVEKGLRECGSDVEGVPLVDYRRAVGTERFAIEMKKW